MHPLANEPNISGAAHYPPGQIFVPDNCLSIEFDYSFYRHILPNLNICAIIRPDTAL
jgi:hypothetical protein